MASAAPIEIRDRVIELRRVNRGDVLPNKKNFRRHPDSQKDAMKGILKEVGVAGAALAYYSERNDNKLTYVDGHLRDELIPENLPVLITDLNDGEADLLLASYDPIAAMATADKEALDSLLHSVNTTDAALQAMLAELAESNGLYLDGEGGSGGHAQETEESVVELVNQAEELNKIWQVKSGDLYSIGSHRLLCGNSTNPQDAAKLMNGEKATLLHGDPPYGMGKEKDGVANDNLYREKLDAFQMAWWRTFRPYLTDNASVYIWGNAEDLWRLWFVGGLKDAEHLSLRNEIVWDKKNIAGMASDLMTQYPMATERCLFIQIGEQFLGNLNSDQYWEGWDEIRLPLLAQAEAAGLTPKITQDICGVGMYSHWFSKSQWQLIPERYYAKLQAKYPEQFTLPHSDLQSKYDAKRGGFRNHINGIQGGMRSYFDNAHSIMRDVWEFPRVVGEDRWHHATPKPVEMVERAIKSSSAEGDVVIVPFGGSGSDFVAAQNLHRKAKGMELQPEYVAVILERMKRAHPDLRIARVGDVSKQAYQ